MLQVMYGLEFLRDAYLIRHVFRIEDNLWGKVYMNIAVLSDIHGNYVALQECINYAINNKIDTFIFWGDYVGELAYPQKTMEILYYALLILAFVDGEHAGNCSFECKAGSRRASHRAGIGIALLQKYIGFGLGRLP